MAKFYILALGLLCFSACDCGVTKLDDGSLNFTKVPKVDVTTTLTSTFDGKGLEPWYDVAKSFIHTVQKDDLPYDDLHKIKEDDFEVAEFLKGWELPFLVVFAIGLLFAIIVPIVGFCFCCCRCCGNCGGEMVQKESSKQGLKRAIFGIVLSILTLLMFTGCLLAFVANDRFTDTVESYKTTPIRAIQDSREYLNQTLEVVNKHIISDVLKVLEIVAKDVTNLPVEIANFVTDSLADLVRKPLVGVGALANETKQMQELLQNITDKTEKLQTNLDVLKQNLSSVEKDLNDTCQLNAGSCTNISFDSLNPGADYSQLPNVTTELNKIIDVNDNNELAENAEKGLNQFNDIAGTVTEKTNETMKDIRESIESATTEFEDQIQNDIIKEVEKIMDNMKDVEKDIDKAFEDQIKPYDKYRYNAGVGLICLILLPVVLMALGLLCGICGHDKHAGPTERGAMSNMGGNFLMAAVGFMFIFVFFLMLFTAICFIFGAHLEKGCYSVREETLYSDFLDVPKYWGGDYILAKEIYQNGSVKLTIGEILSSCRQNKVVYQAIKGYNKWNLTNKFSVKDKLDDIDDQLNDFKVSVNDQEIFTQNTKEGLENLRDSGVDQINFTKFFNETSKTVLNNTEIKELQTTLNATGNAELEKISVRLTEIQKDANSMQELSSQLKKDVEDLKRLGGDIKRLANNTLNDAIKANSSFESEANTQVTDSVVKLSKTILANIDETTNWAVKIFENDLAPCKIVTDVYDATVNLLCRDSVYPFNGFWFSIGFCLFFYIPAIVLCVKLAKHYRRMRFEEGFDKHDRMEMHNVGERNAVFPK